MAKRELPQETVELLKRLYPDESVFNAYVSRLRSAGWSLRAIGDGFGVTNDTAKVRVLIGTPDAERGVAGEYEVPEPPLSKVQASKARAESKRENKYIIPDGVVERINELKVLAFKRGRHTGDDINKASSQFTVLLWDQLQLGASYADLASVTGMTHQAIRFRFGRYGYIPLPPSFSHITVISPDQEDELTA